MDAQLQIRAMTDADLAFADSLRALVGWNQTLRDWQRLLQHEPFGCFIAEWYAASSHSPITESPSHTANRVQSQPVGTVTTTRYAPELGWIGMLLVHPDFRQRGIGQALLHKAMTHLQASGVQCVKLDATPAGQPLYEKLGFRREWTLNRWEREAGQTAQRVGSHRSDVTARGTEGTQPECVIRPFATGDFDEIMRLDALALGANRHEWLGSLVKEARLIVSEVAGRVCGFGVMREGSHAAYCGPVVALETGAARAIISELLSNCEPHRTVFWDVPVPNDSAEQLVREHRFLIQRPLVRMFHGTNAPGAVDYLYAIAGPEVG